MNRLSNGPKLNICTLAVAILGCAESRTAVRKKTFQLDASPENRINIIPPPVRNTSHCLNDSEGDLGRLSVGKQYNKSVRWSISYISLSSNIDAFTDFANKFADKNAYVEGRTCARKLVNFLLRSVTEA